MCVDNLPDSNGKKKQIQTELAFVEVCIVINKIFIQQFLSRNAGLVTGMEERRRNDRKMSQVLWLDVDLKIECMSSCMHQEL